MQGNTEDLIGNMSEKRQRLVYLVSKEKKNKACVHYW